MGSFVIGFMLARKCPGHVSELAEFQVGCYRLKTPSASFLPKSKPVPFPSTMLTSRGLTRIPRSAKKALSSAKRTNAFFSSAAYLSRTSLPSASYTSNVRPLRATQQQASESSLERIWSVS